MVTVTADDEAVRGALTGLIAELGHAPSIDRLAQQVGATAEEVEARLRRLAEAHALVLHPGSARPWVVHPFALAPGSCWVATAARGYWANCLYCGFGIAAALHCDATITTRYGGEEDTIRFRVTNGAVERGDDLFHLSTPAARWWDNVIYACSSFQPFRAIEDVESWCRRHDLPRGAVITIEQLWRLASEWYGGYLDRPWHRRSAAECTALFKRHGLTGPYWQLD